MSRILVTGICGTIGSAILDLLLARDDVDEVVGLDNNESGLFFLEHQHAGSDKVRVHLCDIRDESKLTEMMHGVDTVYHTAAYKHVWLCERSPFEAVQTNIIGVENVIRAARQSGVAKVIFTSSDKAVNPTNVMGASKLMGEKLMTAANIARSGTQTVFASTRFGNVLGSSGSVIPVFREQIRRGGPVTLTDPGMTRFVMSIREAAELVIESSELARGGEIFITKMPVVRIEDLARVMVAELAPAYGLDPATVAVEVIGAKPGEKMYEELMSQEETRRAVELDKYFAVLPAFTGVYRDADYSYPATVSTTVDDPYVSDAQPALDHAALAALLTAHGLLDAAPSTPEEPAHRYWPGSEHKG